MIVTFVSCDPGDWEGMYFDDVLVYENHRIPTLVVAEEIAHAKKLIERIDRAVGNNTTDGPVSEIGRFPNSLSSFTDLRVWHAQEFP